MTRPWSEIKRAKSVPATPSRAIEEQMAALGFAWAEVAALLPPDWKMELSSVAGRSDLVFASALYGYSLRHYRENVGKARYCPFYSAHGETAVEALHGLAAQLVSSEEGWQS